jgi:hypothetical protein
MIFSYLLNFLKSVIIRKGPELEPVPDLVISAPAPGGNLIRLPGSGSTTLLQCQNFFIQLCIEFSAVLKTLLEVSVSFRY